MMYCHHLQQVREALTAAGVDIVLPGDKAGDKAATKQQVGWPMLISFHTIVFLCSTN